MAAIARQAVTASCDPDNNSERQAPRSHCLAERVGSWRSSKGTQRTQRNCEKRRHPWDCNVSLGRGSSCISCRAPIVSWDHSRRRRSRWRTGSTSRNYACAGALTLGSGGRCYLTPVISFAAHRFPFPALPEGKALLSISKASGRGFRPLVISFLTVFSCFPLGRAPHYGFILLLDWVSKLSLGQRHFRGLARDIQYLRWVILRSRDTPEL